MQISTFMLYGIIEALVVLVLLCAMFLLLLRRKQKQNDLQREKIQTLVAEYKKIKDKLLAEREEHAVSNTYKKQINDQLLLTRKYHQSLGATRDIALDLDPESPFERQAAAIRHAILVAEKEALNASKDGTPNWEFLQSKFARIIEFYVELAKKAAKTAAAPAQASGSESPAVDSKELAELTAKVEILEQILEAKHQETDNLQFEKLTLEKRISNLEKFKKLFFEMEHRWKKAKAEATAYYEQLMGMRGQVADSDTFDTILNNYHNVYNDIEKTLLSESESPTTTNSQDDDEFTLDLPAAAIAKSTSSVQELMSGDKRALEELTKLRNLTADQHRLIARLQQKLSEADTIEEKEVIITELETELRKQIGFLQESEMCIQLLEDELARSSRRSNELSSELDSLRTQLDLIPKMQATIRQFTLESKDMLKGLAVLEESNEQLQSETTAPATTTASANNEEYEKVQAQLLALQAQYAELEERYLEEKLSQS